MTTDQWTYRPESDSEDRSTAAETRTDDRAPSVDLSEPEDHPPARRSTDAPTAPQFDDEAGFPSRATAMAILSHMSVLFGIPVFLVPLIQRKHALSLHHAKAASLIWFFFYALLAVSIYVSGLFLPLAFLFYVPGLVGIYRAVQGRDAGKWGLGDLGERLFPFPKVRER